MKKLGFDIGATSIKGGIVENGAIIKNAKTPTNAMQGVNAVLKSLYSVIDELIDYADGDAPIGISSTGDINPKNGSVIFATDSMPSYTGLNIRETLEQKYKRKTNVINDCISALIGECSYGAAAGLKDVVMLTLGTGVGGAVMTDGNLLLGSHYQACRLGHISLYKKGRRCPCGKNGCAEAYVSATGLLKTANLLGGNYKDCNEIFTDSNKLYISKVVDSFTNDLALLIRNCVNIFDPQKVIVGGGLILMPDEFWWNRLQEKTADKNLLIKAKLGNSSGIIGATCADLKEFI